MAKGFGVRPCGGGSGRRPRTEGGWTILTLADAARAVLGAASPAAKIKAARKAARDWRLGRLEWRFDAPMPDKPERPALPELLLPTQMPRRGKGGNAANRVALLHAIAHIEYVAIDLAFDMAGRFGGMFPRGFTDDWVKVGAEEAMHFALIERRLRCLGSFYGALPAHDGLWEAAEQTAHDALARLAVVPMVLEARGLDVTPPMITRFAAAGDTASARVLERILSDEVRHVAAGVRWFEFACGTTDDSSSAIWQRLLAEHFGGALKPPFNDSARTAAGLTIDYYQAVAQSHAYPPQKFQSSREGQFSKANSSA